MRLVLVAAALVFEPRSIAMFLSLPIFFHYKPYYETHEFLLSSVLVYYAVLLIMNLMVGLMVVLMLVIHRSSLTCCHLLCKIIFEAPMGHRERGRYQVCCSYFTVIYDIVDIFSAHDLLVLIHNISWLENILVLVLANPYAPPLSI
jgi:hypothetical protein